MFEKCKLFLVYNNMKECSANPLDLCTFLCIVLFHPQKIEVLDEDEEDDDYNVELMASDLEQMQSLLEFKVNRHRRAQLHAVAILSVLVPEKQYNICRYARLNGIHWTWQRCRASPELLTPLISCLSARGSAVLRT